MLLTGMDFVAVGREDVLKLAGALTIAKLVGGRELLIQWAENDLLGIADELMQAAQKIKAIEDKMNEMEG